MKFITISTEDLGRLLELSANYPFAVIDSNTNTDGEGKWHCDVEFYDEQGDEDPIELFSFNETRDNYIPEDDSTKKYMNYVEIRDFFIGKDIEAIAEQRGVKLEDHEVKLLVDQYVEDHDMNQSERGMIENLIERYKDLGKEDL